LEKIPTWLNMIVSEDRFTLFRIML